MTEPKTIVIKVKYTAPDAAAESPASASRMVTEWNIKRIAGAVGVVILLLVSLLFLLRGKIDQAAATRSENAPKKAPAFKPAGVKAEPQSAMASIKPDTSPGKAEPQPASTSVESASSSAMEKESMRARHSSLSASAQGGRIRRAALAYRIIDKEPAELIGTTVSISNGKPVLVHYFTEVRGRTAQILFHEWIKNGETILRHPMAIAAERWRTSSQHLFGQDDLGNWSVRTVDDKGALMNEIHFTVSAK